VLTLQDVQWDQGFEWTSALNTVSWDGGETVEELDSRNLPPHAPTVTPADSYVYYASYSEGSELRGIPIEADGAFGAQQAVLVTRNSWMSLLGARDDVAYVSVGGGAIARYGFGAGAIPLQESVVWMHAIVFRLGISYTLKARDHVRVDIVYQRFSPRLRALVDLAGTLLLLLPVALFIFWTSLDYVSLSWRMGEGSAEPGGLPGVYLLKTLIPLMAVLLIAQGIAEALRSVMVLIRRDG